LIWTKNICHFFFIQFFIAGNFGVNTVARQLLQLNAHSFIKIAMILQHTSSYMFQDLLAHHQAAHNWTKQLLNIFCMWQNCWKLLNV
jgi:hypothetical protein